LFTYDLIFQKVSDLDVAIKGMMLNPVRSFIEDQVITAEPVTGIRRIAEVMYRYNLRVMPITDATVLLSG
jgi:CBS domain-containing protein